MATPQQTLYQTSSRNGHATINHGGETRGEQANVHQTSPCLGRCSTQARIQRRQRVPEMRLRWVDHVYLCRGQGGEGQQVLPLCRTWHDDSSNLPCHPVPEKGLL